MFIQIIPYVGTRGLDAELMELAELMERAELMEIISGWVEPIEGNRRFASGTNKNESPTK